jgi:hypothetical protein
VRQAFAICTAQRLVAHAEAYATDQRMRRYYAFVPRTTAKGSGLAHGTSFVSENHAPTAFVLNCTLMRSPRTLMHRRAKMR